VLNIIPILTGLFEGIFGWTRGRSPLFPSSSPLLHTSTRPSAVRLSATECLTTVGSRAKLNSRTPVFHTLRSFPPPPSTRVLPSALLCFADDTDNPVLASFLQCASSLRPPQVHYCTTSLHPRRLPTPHEAPSLPAPYKMPSQNVQSRHITPVIGMSTLLHVLLPSTPDLQYGVKSDGPPVWTSWLESWYVAYDPLVWTLLKEDDDEDERMKNVLRAAGLRLLDGKASKEAIYPFEYQHFVLMIRRLLRRERIYREFSSFLRSLPFFLTLTSAVLHLTRQRFLDYHQSRKPGLTDSEVLQRELSGGNDTLNCPFPPHSSAFSTFFPPSSQSQRVSSHSLAFPVASPSGLSSLHSACSLPTRRRIEPAPLRSRRRPLEGDAPTQDRLRAQPTVDRSRCRPP
jgi:hypothetical protein